MKEVKQTVTEERIVGYEAFDGKRFPTKEDCITYESTAEGVITKEFYSLMVDGEPFSECCIFENYGYGSEEYSMAVIDIKTEDDLAIANRYYEFHKVKHLIPREYIGKRVLVNIGCEYDRYVSPLATTYDEIVENFKADMAKFFFPETKEEQKEGE